MEIKGKVHCLFEQSGTFRDEFIRLGVPAEDYDIQDWYGKTDHVCDLFEAVGAAWDGLPSLFDGMTPDDLLVAFFPCIYFEGLQQTFFSLCARPTRGWTMRRRIEFAMDRLERRSEFHRHLYRLYGLCHERGLRLIIENPFGNPYLIHGQNFPAPTLVDVNRMTRGDYYVKPTAYWFVNCEPVRGGGGDVPERQGEEADNADALVHPDGDVLPRAVGDKPGLCPELHLRLHPGAGAAEQAARD